jgi:hypothetical protein
MRSGDLKASVVLLATGAGLFSLIWLAEVAGDPSRGLLFFMLVFAAPLLVGIGLVIAASRRRDLFRTRGLVGSILILVTSLVPDIVGFVGAALGLLLMALGVAERGRRLVAAIAILLVGVVGLGLRLESGDGIEIFVPVLAVGTAVLAGEVRRLDA